MNLPNKFTMLRIALIPLLVVLMYQDNAFCYYLSILVFAVAAFTDFLDGHIARKHHIVTDFGKFLDPVADKLLVLSTMMMLCQQDLLGTFVVIIILARELLVDGLRMIAVGKGQVIAAGKLGKIKTVSQIILILWLLVLRVPVGRGAPGIITLLMVAWVVIITAWSGLDYFVKNGRFLLDSK